MRRVAFIFNPNSQWIGGTNLLRSLAQALKQYGNECIEPIIVTPPLAATEVASMFPGCEILTSPWVSSDSIAPSLNRKIAKLTQRDVVLDYLLKKHGIDVLSHSGFLGTSSSVATIGWIPDFQHRFLPHLFSRKELIRRDLHHSRLARLCDAVILSSETAYNHFVELFPKQAAKARVVRFPATLPSLSSLPSLRTLENRYNFRGAYFFLPNQFWSHKNHLMVARALGIVRARGINITVLACGAMSDYRGNSHIEELRRVIIEERITDNFRLLGVIPYLDLIGLLRNSIGLINPSLFEGWSTTVEEGKAMGKYLILSDIPVHREQASSDAAFVAPDDPLAMAQALLKANEKFDARQIDRNVEKACAANHQRLCKYSRTFSSVVTQVIEERARR